MNEFVLEDSKITIEYREYLQLIRDSIKLYALEAGGVDNWEFYDDAVEDFHRRFEDWKTR